MQINLVFARRVEHQAPMQRFEHSFEYFQSLSQSGDLGNLVVIFLHDDRSDWPHETRLPHEIHGIRIFIIQPKVYFFFILDVWHCLEFWASLILNDLVNVDGKQGCFWSIQKWLFQVRFIEQSSLSLSTWFFKTIRQLIASENLWNKRIVFRIVWVLKFEYLICNY